MDIRLSSCLICKKSEPGDPEHIIPQVIGGMLEADLLCDKCNKYLGSTLVSKLKRAPMFILAVDNLKNGIPKIYKAFIEKATFKGVSPDGSEVRMIKKNNDLFVQPHCINGVLEIDTRDGEKIIGKMLERMEPAPESVSRLINKFRSLGNEDLLELPNGKIIRKMPINKISKKLPTTIIQDKFWVLIAFEFLSLFLGDKVLYDRFDPIRGYIMNDIECNLVEISHFQGGKKYQAIHVIQIEGVGNDTLVTIRLFRWIVTKVLFHNIKYSIDPISYVEDTKNRTKAIVLSEEDVRNGKWIPID